ncbi:MAG: hypothetical protein U9Q33_01660, partial [Campylobacterota bacterium]|nr:hypothetical protein [Campylobacterota bacterium]
TSKGEYKACEEIENDVYVFTDISYFKLVNDKSYKLIYEMDTLIRVHKAYLIDSDMNIFSKVLNDLQKRKVSKSNIAKLENMLDSLNFLPRRYDELVELLEQRDLDIPKPLFDEFRWRCLLYDSDVYQTNTKPKDIETLKKRRVKIADEYSILKNTFRYYPFEVLMEDLSNFQKDFNEFREYEQFGLKRLLARKAVELRENEQLDYYFNRLSEYGTFADSYKHKAIVFKRIVEKYEFLNDPYSKQYRETFQKYRKILSRGQAFRVFKKFKDEYKIAKEIIDKLVYTYKQLLKYEQLLKDIEFEYQKDIGFNSLQNDGFGIVGDGWDFSVGDGEVIDVSEEKRIDEKLEKEQEEQCLKDKEREIEEAQDNAYYESQKLDNLIHQVQMEIKDLKKYDDPILDFIYEDYDNITEDNVYKIADMLSVDYD